MVRMQRIRKRSSGIYACMHVGMHASTRRHVKLAPHVLPHTWAARADTLVIPPTRVSET